VDFYEILGLDPTCSQKDIKKSFRARAKRLHPDIIGFSEDAQNEMRKLLEAYEVLSLPERRRDYDRLYRRTFEKRVFNYRSFLKSRAGDPESLSKLVFFDLLHAYEDEAIDIFESLCRDPIFRIGKYLDREDTMDCSFLLGEEYEKRARYYQAFKLYGICFVMERQKPYFKHFTEELEIRMKELVRVKLKKLDNEDEMLECLETMIAFEFPPKDEAQFQKKKAEILFSRGRAEEARHSLIRAIMLDPALSGTRGLKKKLGAP
jgi:curved DNA-binding protein CbpA